METSQPSRNISKCAMIPTFHRTADSIDVVHVLIFPVKICFVCTDCISRIGYAVAKNCISVVSQWFVLEEALKCVSYGLSNHPSKVLIVRGVGSVYPTAYPTTLL